jgi:hypothetical protein
VPPVKPPDVLNLAAVTFAIVMDASGFEAGALEATQDVGLGNGQIIVVRRRFNFFFCHLYFFQILKCPLLAG